MKNLKVWGKPAVTETKVRFAAGGVGSTTDKSAQHHS